MNIAGGTSGSCLVSLLAVVALALAACGGSGGGNGGNELASPDTTTTASIETSIVTTTAAPPKTGGTVARRARLPGPPGPVGPVNLLDAIGVWHPLAEAGVPGGDCRPLLDSVEGRLGREVAAETGGAAYVALYRGIAEGCLGRVEAARTSLGQARRVGLGPDETSKDRTCNAQTLLAFGFATYLDQTITPTCPASTTTTRGSTTAGRAPTTTRPSTSSSRTSTPTTR